MSGHEPAGSAAPAKGTRPDRPDLRVTDVGRGVAAMAMAGAAMVHFAYAPAHFDHATTHGSFFVAMGWAQLILAGALALRVRPPQVWLGLTVAVNTGIMALWLVSRTAGLPGQEVEAVSFPDALATGLEIVAALAAAALLLELLVDRPVRPLPTFGIGGVAAVTTMLLVSLSIAPSIAGEHHHGDAAGHQHGEGADGHAHEGEEAAGAAREHDAAEHAEEGHDDSGTSDHEHDDGDSSSDSGHDHDTGNRTTSTTHPPGHDHDTTTTLPPDGHDHGTPPTTAPGGHDHGPPTGPDWATTRLLALTGHLPAAKIEEFRQLSYDNLASEIRQRSDLLRDLPEAEREARIATFANWSVDNALTAENGHSHGPAPWQPLTDPADQRLLQEQLNAAATIVPQFPTAADAVAAGYRQVTPYIPGIASHYINFSLTDRTFEPERPEILLYNGNSSTSVLVGVSYATFGTTPVEGFVGSNDEWHGHPSLCIVGTFVVGPDHTPRDLCQSIGASQGNISLWMAHLWQVPGWQSDWGLFSGENPNVNMATSDLMQP